MKRRKHIRSEFNIALNRPTQTPEDPGVVGVPDRRNRPARPSFVSGFWRGVGQQVNDNAGGSAGIRYLPGTWFAALSAFSLALGTLVSLSGSAVTLKTITYMDDRVLERAMEIDPDALAFMFNEVDAGEQHAPPQTQKE